MQMHPTFRRLLAQVDDSQLPNKYQMDAASHKAVRQAYLALLEEALRQKPEDNVYQNNYGLTLSRLDRDEEALQCFQRLLEQDPDNTQVMNNVGMALNKLKRYEEARVYMQRLVELNPDHAIYQNNLAVPLRKLERLEEALTHNERALELEPDNIIFQTNLACTLNKLGRHDEALRVLKEMNALKYDGDLQIEVLHEEGIALAATGKKEEGIFLLQHAFKLAAKAQNGRERNDIAATLTNLGVPVPEVA